MKLESSPSKSRRLAVPLSEIQIDILRLLASHRNPASYVAGTAALNRNAPRYSQWRKGRGLVNIAMSNFAVNQPASPLVETSGALR